MDSNIAELSVSEFSLLIKNHVEHAFPEVSIRGEISGYKAAPSGHVYFSLKDNQSVLACVSWRGTAQRFTFKPEDGIEVVCRGSVTTYGGQSRYQLVVEAMQLAGLGALMALLEKRKQQLQAEGLFDPSRKQLLPPFPQCIGIVTSPTGAVIQDILHRLQDRYPVQVFLWPVLVQGEQAAGQIAAAIHGFNALPDKSAGLAGPYRPDILIVARGGGSIEDLWAFNEEIVVRAAAASMIPLISAVGHETDTTLIDYAADVRAPTPTAAAELATPHRQGLLAHLAQRGDWLTSHLRSQLELKQHRIQGLCRGLISPRAYVLNMAQSLDQLERRLSQVWQHSHRHRAQKLQSLSSMLMVHSRLILERAHQRLSRWANLLTPLNYEATLARGYAAMFDTSGKAITTPAMLAVHTPYRLQLSGGTCEVSLEKVAK
jgi:exodeoxyribonuclease VII large subunit